MIDEMKRQKRELVYKGSILDIYKDTMQFANGKTEEWDFVSHRKGAAAVLPVLDDGRIIMVRQYRNALERETIEIPAGCRDFVGEDTRLCAERELKEETGYSSELMLLYCASEAFSCTFFFSPVFCDSPFVCDSSFVCDSPAGIICTSLPSSYS